jgi:hypothetical protein
MTKKREKERPLTREEAEKQVADLSPDVRATLDKYWGACRDLRQTFGPGIHITREDVAFAAGTNSIDMASKWMALIEPIEGDQPFQTRPKKPSRDKGEAPSQHAPAVQAAIDGVVKALELVSKAFRDTQAAEVAEITRGFQTALQEQGDEFEEERQAGEALIADLRKAASGSGNRSWLNHEAAQELRAKLAAVEAELNAALARAEQANHGEDLAQVKLASAAEQVAALQAGAALQLAEVSRLLEERKGLEAAVAQTVELRAENAGLTARAAALADQIGRLENRLAEMDARYERERSAQRAAHDRELGEQRQRSADREARLLGLVAHGRNEETMQGNGGPTPSGERA